MKFLYWILCSKSSGSNRFSVCLTTHFFLNYNFSLALTEIEEKYRTYNQKLFSFIFCCRQFALYCAFLAGPNLKLNKWKAQIMTYTIQHPGKADKLLTMLGCHCHILIFIFLQMRDVCRLKHKIASTSLTNFEASSPVLISHCKMVRCCGLSCYHSNLLFRMNWIMGLLLREEGRGICFVCLLISALCAVY